MFNVSQEKLQGLLIQLNQALYNHEQWYKNIIRTLVCRQPYDSRDVVEDAHQQCRFGQWYYNRTAFELPDISLLSNAAFAAIGVEHEQLHKLAGQLLLKSSTNSITPNDYDVFANALDRLRLEIQTLKREVEDALYHHDPLTGAEGRIGMLTKLRELHAMSKLDTRSCCLAIMDLDRFKAVNDTYGHIVGDQVLVNAARYVMEHLRPYDKIYRFGGEEFLISMPDTSLQAGYAVIERLRQGLASTVLAYHDEDPLFVTASFGLTLLDPDVIVEESIDRADKAMYAAKKVGRNCTQIWNPSMEEPYNNSL